MVLEVLNGRDGPKVLMVTVPFSSSCHYCVTIGLQVWNGGSVVGCKSACLAFGNPEYCCTGSHNTPATCPPTGYSRIFKQACPDAYSYAYDDLTSTFTCTGADYTILFCP